MDYNKQAIICLGTCHWRVQGIFSPFQVSQIRLLVTRQLTASIVYVYFYFILCIKLKKCLNVMKCNSVSCTLWPHGGKVFLSRRLSSNSKQISQGVAVRFNTHLVLSFCGLTIESVQQHIRRSLGGLANMEHKTLRSLSNFLENITLLYDSRQLSLKISNWTTINCLSVVLFLFQQISLLSQITLLTLIVEISVGITFLVQRGAAFPGSRCAITSLIVKMAKTRTQKCVVNKLVNCL